MLPLLHYRDRIRESLKSRKKLIVTAPPGTGKSTQIPQFFIDDCSPQKKILVLEPRRIAARSLAVRVAEERGGVCGGEVGYQVRSERKTGGETRLLYLTYGTFLQMLLSDPLATFASIIVFDEFHERSLDADVALAWVRWLREKVRDDLSIMVLSATLETDYLQTYLDGPAVLDVQENMFPVSLRYQPPLPRESLPRQVERALSGLSGDGKEGSILVFLPGVFEIERTAEALYDTCRRRGYRLLQLHGKMPLDKQQEALRLPGAAPCVILSTNVAETSLTIPGVTVVIDAGLARVAAYDPERERNTLYCARISLQNAAQRAGRAGRLTHGTCVRLWSTTDERAMPAAIVPELMRLDLAKSMLTLCWLAAHLKHGRPNSIELPAVPPEGRWSKARDVLLRCGAIAPAASASLFGAEPALPLFPLTPFGVKAGQLPLEPLLAALLLQSRSREERIINIAMAALWESAETVSRESVDLYDRAIRFLDDPADREWGREARETFDRINRLLQEDLPEMPEAKAGDATLRAHCSRLWMKVFSDRIAARGTEGSVYTMKNGRSARLVVKTVSSIVRKELPGLIVALSVHERAGRDVARQATIPLYLPLEELWVAEEFADQLRSEVECRWDESRKRVVIEKFLRISGTVCGRREVEAKGRYCEMASAFLARKLREGGIGEWQSDEPTAQFINRMKLIAAHYPKANLPSMTPDDWELVYTELCEGKVSLEEIKKASVLSALKSYIGPHRVRLIEKMAPESIILPSGKKGRITYFEAALPEMSARLGDLIGYKPRFLLVDGRVQGVFNILAPNFRTVQKTPDLGSFWKTAYPSIKKELQRRYPRHPWP